MVDGRRPDMIDVTHLFAEHGARLIEIAAAVIGVRSDAEDVVQEAFIKAYRGRSSFRGDASPGTWLRRIVLNEALDFRRRAFGRDGKRRPGGPGSSGGRPDEQPGRGPAPETQASEVERADAVRRAIDALPEEQRTVVLLREMEGLGYREIAELLGLPLGTVESRVLRARERLRVALRAHLASDAEEAAVGGEEGRS